MVRHLRRSSTKRPLVLASVMVAVAGVAAAPAPRLVLSGRFAPSAGPTLTHGQKLSQMGESGNGDFGTSVALSSSGAVMLVGAPFDRPEPRAQFPAGKGAVWVFIRAGSTWKQLGPKLTPNDESGYGDFGSSVALSGDGNTALIGGVLDNNRGGIAEGAVWVFKRSGGKFVQSGKKLAPQQNGDDEFGASIALTPNGDTALIGGPASSNGTGKAWVYARTSAGQYKEEATLEPSNVSQSVFFGIGASVALSSDGSTAVLGAPGSAVGRSGSGGAYVFVKTASGYAETAELLPKDAVGQAGFGGALALSADGKTLLMGGPADDNGDGAVCVFARSGNKWAQQGPKIVSGEGNDQAAFGASLAMDPGGSVVFVGGPGDDHSAGAVWALASSGTGFARGAEFVVDGETGVHAFGASAVVSGNDEEVVIGGSLDHPGAAVAGIPVGVGAAWSYGLSLT